MEAILISVVEDTRDILHQVLYSKLMFNTWFLPVDSIQPNFSFSFFREEHREQDPNRTTFSSTFNFNYQPHAFPNKDFERCKDVCIGAERWEDFKDTYSNEYWEKE